MAAPIPSNHNFPTATQVPNNSIMDLFNKQTYLGNQFVAASTVVTLSGTTEHPVMLMQNPSTNTKSLFSTARKLYCAASAGNVIFRLYSQPTFLSAGVQTVALVADTSGSLNSTYFLLNDALNVHKYYVWFNINSAGVDPAVAGRTGVPIAGATNASAATLGAAVAVAVAALNSTASFTATGTSTVMITNKVTGTFTPMIDGSSATGFTFAVTGSAGTTITPINCRPANSNTSGAVVGQTPVISANGTLIATFSVGFDFQNLTDVLLIFDPGQNLLITGQAVDSGTTAIVDVIYYEI